MTTEAKEQTIRIHEAYAEAGGLIGAGVEWDEASAARINKHKCK